MKHAEAVAQMAADGIKHDAHHGTIKAAYKKLTGAALDKDTLDLVRGELEDAKPKRAKAEKVALPAKEAMAKAQALVKERAKDADMPGWDNVTKVVEAGPDGKPVRVEIECQDPQETRDGESVCEGKREIAAQDVFQVSRCAACQKRVNVLARNEAAKARREAANKATKKVKKSA